MSSTEPQSPILTTATPTSEIDASTIPTGILDAILAGYTDPVCVYDRAGRHLYASPASARALGKQPGDILGKTNREIGVLPETCTLIEETINQVFTHNRAITVEIAYPTVDGVREYETTYSPIYAADGALHAALSIPRDVTERNQAQRAYRRQTARYQQLLENSLEGMLAVDVNEIITYANPRLEQMLCNEPGELIGGSPYDLLFPEDMDEARQRRLERSQGSQEQYEVRLRRRDGEEVWALACVNVVWEEDEYAGAFTMFVDITARKHMEQALNRSYKRFDLVQAASGLGIFYCDLPFDKLIWNDNVKRHFGLPLDAEVTIKTFYERLHPDDRERTHQAIERSIKEHTDYDIDYRTVGLDGKTRWIRAIGHCFYSAAGQPVSFDGITIDVTERKSAEEERERNLAEIQLLNVRLRRAMMETHDLVRNNLQIVNALAEMHVAENADVDSARAMRRIKLHVGTLADIHGVMTHNAREYGEGQKISVKSLLAKMLPALQSLAEGRRLRLRADDTILNTRIGIAVAMISNELVTNAIKHGAGEIDIDFHAADCDAILAVHDHGAGFPAEFDPAAFDGGGIDLIQSLSRWTLRGKAAYENAPHGGASVSITFPL